jgi:phosphatidylserine/phosphatidylglycerophosphate/cardiolipin synthase-like enzyme
MATRTASGTAPALGGATLELDGLRGYFQSRRAGLDAHLAARLVEFIDGTRDSLDCAIYDLRHPDVLAALARLVARGVRLRIAFDASTQRSGGAMADPKPSGTRQALANAGLLPHATPVHEHGRHLMHLKFALRDRHVVWVGSANFTRGGLELQDNVCFVLDSTDLAAAFGATFEGLVGPQHRHALAAAAGPAPVRVGGATLRPYFAPAAGEGIEEAIVAAVRGARRIRVLAFLLSDPGILGALAPLASNPRFDIRGVYDPHGMQDALRYARQDRAHFWFLDDPRFVAAPSHAFSPGREQDFMHNKALIIDDRLVFTGSYNFSENAEANDEVVVAIESPAVAAAYTAYFDALFGAYGAGRTPVSPTGNNDPVASTRGAELKLSGRATPAHRRRAGASPAAASLAGDRGESVDGADEAQLSHGAPRRMKTLDVLVVAIALLAVVVAVALGIVLVASGLLRP